MAMQKDRRGLRRQCKDQSAWSVGAIRDVWGWITTLVTLLVLVMGVFLVFTAAVGATSGLPFWVAIPICFVVPVVIGSGLGSLAHRLGAPRSWLVFAGSGGMLIAAPLLVRWVNGSWSASFEMPGRRGRFWWLEVSDYAWWSVAIGGTLVAAGLIKYFVGIKQKGSAAN